MVAAIVGAVVVSGCGRLVLVMVATAVDATTTMTTTTMRMEEDVMTIPAANVRPSVGRRKFEAALRRVKPQTVSA